MVQKCRAVNQRWDVTGMMLYKDGAFLQVLEGPDRAIGSLMQSVQTDPRHFGVVVLSEEPLAEREYPDWSMAFHNLDTAASQSVPGYAPFEPLALNGPEFQSDPDLAQDLLALFRNQL